uniref:DUF7802 domain-containing protein n=1 Tax=Chromera velia CCMP2878 TaxID=1169474 RepID=A0A0G4HUB6_9ALVE|eukprot:Cvel_31790.t1-p1 / transcript=Cvel_31790.t1 / gene=Cvel_31790 / organism=Chromera_velia_CCMP2878 / gene_product=hypothetical protein / transcript_product=hypothetical protein / location=Cvel_scaffold4802:2258-4543(-) / protein_length=418 / sequence_SO=supercontig / SO=protein_coding / is_pseudo=false
MSDFHSIFPLVSFGNWQNALDSHPSYLLIDLLFHGLFIVCALHAIRHDRWHKALFTAALLGGIAIELLTVLNHKHIGNFYHAPAPTVTLLGNREPLYMALGCYAFLPYAAVAIPRRVGLKNIWAETALAGLLGTFLWGLLDQVGLKQLWWTWHNDEPLYADRNFGVPIASSFWILSSVASLSFLMRVVENFTPFEKVPSILLVPYSVLIGLSANLLLMHIPFNLLYHPMATMLGLPARYPFDLLRVICLLRVVFSEIFLYGRKRATDSSFGFSSSISLGVFVYVLSILSIALFFDPTLVRRASFGQPLSVDPAECVSSTEASFWGAFQRRRFVCRVTDEDGTGGAEALRDNYDFSCLAYKALPSSEDPASLSFYEVCGTPTPPGWTLYVCGMAVFLLSLVVAAERVQGIKGAAEKKTL